MFKELDVVRLKDGNTATVLDVYSSGEVYLVEVTDKDGRTLAMPIVSKSDIMEVIWRG